VGQLYVIALGSNRRHHRYGGPAKVLRAALGEIDRNGVKLEAVSPIVASAPLGPSRRRFANAAVLVKTRLAPDALLVRLKAIERAFGRRRAGRRWGSRVLDLDLVPHPAFRQRRFVVAPAAAVAPRWRDPLTGQTLRHLLARLTRPHPLPIGPAVRALSSVGRATDF
jgi:2-amino-4-hydroxy-6-hydroxymethyldihydropteridine diphosphokinase